MFCLGARGVLECSNRGTPTMSADLSPEHDALVSQLVADGLYPDRCSALDHAIELLREESETLAAIREGLASADRGEGTPLEEAVRTLRREYQIPDEA